MKRLPPLLLLSVSLAGTGCGREEPKKPASRPAEAATTTRVAVEEVGDSVLTIGGKEARFAPGRIEVDQRESKVVARVFSDGATPEGTADGYYFDMAMEMGDSGQLDGASWQYVPGKGGEEDETLSGITINGGANRLRPADVTVRFRAPSEGVVEVRVAGFFDVLKGETAVNRVAVEGTIMAKRVGS